jgi:hypothetical protein
MDQRQRDSQLSRRFHTEYRALTAQLAHIGFIWGGSIQTQWLTCGTPGCACHRDPHARHGPYVYWTSKVAGRTVSRLLQSPEAELLSEWVQNRRKLDQTVREMKKLSQKAAKVMLRLQDQRSGL